MPWQLFERGNSYFYWIAEFVAWYSMISCHFALVILLHTRSRTKWWRSWRHELSTPIMMTLPSCVTWYLMTRWHHDLSTPMTMSFPSWRQTKMWVLSLASETERIGTKRFIFFTTWKLQQRNRNIHFNTSKRAQQARSKQGIHFELFSQRIKLLLNLKIIIY